MLSPVRLSSVVSSVTLAHPTQAIVSFGNLVPWPSIDIHRKFYGDRLSGTPPPGELNTRGSKIIATWGLSKADEFL